MALHKKYIALSLAFLVTILGATLLWQGDEPADETVDRRQAMQAFAPYANDGTEKADLVVETGERTVSNPVQASVVDFSQVTISTETEDGMYDRWLRGELDLDEIEGIVSAVEMNALLEESMQAPFNPSVKMFPETSAYPPTFLSGFDSLDFNDGGGSVPPDPEMAAGPNHVIATVNVALAIYDKAGNVVFGPTAAGNLYSQSPCTSGLYDPNVVYDEEAGRWIIAYDQGAFTTTGGYCLLASQTSDPLGSWNEYFFQMNDASGWMDYPHAGVGDEHIFVGGNIFSQGGAFVEGRIYAFDKADLYAGNATTMIVQGLGSNLDTAQPLNLHGAGNGTWPAFGNTHYFISDSFFDGENYALLEWDPTNTGFTNHGTINIGTGDMPVSSLQNGTTTLAGNDYRPQDFEYRNGYGWTTMTHGCNPGSGQVNCITWAQVDLMNVTSPPTLGPAGNATYGTDGEYRSFPDLAVNHCGDMVIGYTKTSASTFPGIWFSGRQAGDPAGALQAETLAKAGEIEYVSFQGSGSANRWGDYTGMTIDPDGTTFWYLGEYSKDTGTTNGRWGNYISAITFDTCGAGATGTISGTVTALHTGLGLEGAFVSASGSGTGGATTDADGNYSMNVITGTYTVTFSANNYQSVIVNNVDVLSGTVTTVDATLEGSLLSYAPTDVEENMELGDVVTTTIILTNTGPLTISTSIDLNAAEPDWVSVSATSADIAPNSTSTFDVVFDSTSLFTLGEYNASISFDGTFVNSVATLPLTMNLACSTCGVLAGDITDDFTGDPLVADINITGSSTDVTISGSSYAVGLPAGTYDILVTANDYFSQTVTVTSTTGTTTTTDFALVPMIAVLEYDMTAYEESLNLGDVSTHTLVLTNTGTIPFDFSLSDYEDDFSPARPAVETVCPADSFGYTCLDSNETNGPTYNWMDISGTGTATGLSDDAYFFPVDIPFDFNFYGTDYNQIAIGSNGTVYFEDVYLGLGNIAIPGNAATDAFVAVYWDDLNPGSSGDVYYEVVGDAPNQMLVVQWEQVPHFGTSDNVTVQAILFEGSNNVLVQYLDPSGEAGSGATTGIQGDPSTGIQYNFNTATLTAELAICYVHPSSVDTSCSGLTDAPWLSESPDSGTLNAGESVTVDIVFDAGQVSYAGTYTGAINIAGTFDNEAMPISAVLHVVCPTCGVLDGDITDSETGDPVDAMIEVSDNAGFYVVQTGSSYAVTTPPGDYDIQVSATGYITEVVSVTASGNTTVTTDIAITPAYATLEYTPSEIEEFMEVGDIVTNTLTVTNSGTITLTFEAMISNEVFPAKPQLTVDPVIHHIENTEDTLRLVTDLSKENSTKYAEFGGDIVADGSFEAGTPNPSWNESSTNFGSPLCTVTGCGTGTGTGPNTGDWWAWFGGVSAVEEGTVSQDVVIPSGGATLIFYLEQILCDSSNDYLEVTIDGTQVFVSDGDSPLCGVLGYSEQQVDISAFADGQTHTLEFRSEIFATNGGGSNFFVDDVSIVEGGIGSGPWASVTTGMFDVAPGETTTLDVVFNASGLYQLGEYTADLTFDGNFNNSVATMPLTMHLSCPTCGVLTGDITDDFTGDPLSADITITGADTTIALTGDTYSVGVPAGMYEINASAAGYISQTVMVTATTGVTVVTDFSLLPIGRFLEVSVSELEETVGLGSMTTRIITLTNSGTVALEYDLSDEVVSAPTAQAIEALVCSSPNTAIPDNDPAGLDDSLTLNAGTANGLQVHTMVDHTWAGDLIMTLTNDSTGTSVTIYDRPGYVDSGFGCSGDNVNIILSDDATLVVEDDCQPDPAPAFTDGEMYLPNNPLSGFDGEALAGTWTLNISDNANDDTGTLVGWCIDTGAEDAEWLTQNPVSGTIEAGESVVVEIGFDASVVTQTGTYEAMMSVAGNFDNVVAPIMTTMHVTEAVAGLTLDVTVSTDGSCGTESSIAVDNNDTVFYCYTVTNTGNVMLPNHIITDSVYGHIDTFIYNLQPGETESVIYPQTVTGATNSTVTWNASHAGLGMMAEATDTVEVTLNEIVIYLPFITMPAP